MICALLLLALQDSFNEKLPTQVLFGETPSDHLQFGRRLGLSDESLIVTSLDPHPDGLPNSLGGSSSGALYVFDREGGAFVQTQLLWHPELRHWFDFASWLDVDSDRLVMTDSSATDNGEHVFLGRAYIYERVAETWTLTQTIQSTKTGNSHLFFGGSGGLEGNRLLLCEPGHPGIGAPNNGIIRLFDHDGQSFVETSRITSPPELAAIPGGFATPLNQPLVLDGDTLMMMAVDRVIVWERSAAGVWEFTQQLTRPNFDPVSAFAVSLAIDGDWMVAGHRPSPSGFLQGRVEVFRRDQATSLWEYHQTLRAADGLAVPPQGFDNFGDEVSLSNGRALIGAPNTRNELGIVVGAAYTYLLGEDGFWHPEAVLRTDRSTTMTTGSGPFVGVNVLLDDGLAVVYSLADYRTDPALREGSVALFELPVGLPACQGQSNSVSGNGARMEVLGRSFASYGAWTIEGHDLPPMSAVLPLMGTAPGSSTVSQGELCLGGTLFRLGSAFGFSDGVGHFSESFENGDGLVEPDVLAGSTWHFQLWYRDLNPTVVSNFSSSVQLTFQ